MCPFTKSRTRLRKSLQKSKTNRWMILLTMHYVCKGVNNIQLGYENTLNTKHSTFIVMKICKQK